MISIRKLAAVDMVLHGARVITIEFALGVILPLLVGLYSLRGFFASGFLGWQEILGFWLITVAANYIPLFLYAVSLARAGAVEAEGRPELPRVTRYGAQQVMIFVPFMVVIVALAQEARR